MRHVPVDLSSFDLRELDEEPRVPYTGKMTHLFSVSQLKLIPPSKKGCPRKWFLMYPFHMPKLPAEALIDGVILHKCLNQWFVMKAVDWSAAWRIERRSPTGKTYNWYAELALAMLRHVPERERTDGVSEATFFLDIPELDSAIYIKPDFLNVKKFRDWKSTAARVKTSEWVLQDPQWWGLGGVPQDGEHFTVTNDLQSRLYAHGLMQLADWDVIDAEWVYGCKKFKAGESVKTWVCPTRFERVETERWVRQYAYPLIEFAKSFKVAWAEKQFDSPLLMPHNAKACEAMGKFCDAYLACRLHKSQIPLDVLHLPVIPQ